MNLLLLAILQQSPTWIPAANFDSPLAAAANWAGQAERCLRDVTQTGDAASSTHCIAMYLLGDIYREVAENHPQLVDDEVRAWAARAGTDSSAAIAISRRTYEARLRAQEQPQAGSAPGRSPQRQARDCIVTNARRYCAD